MNESIFRGICILTIAGMMALAQTTLGTITGRVLDSTGAAVAGAAVDATVSSFDPNRDLWINKDAFGVPAPSSFGSSARSYSDLRAPSYLNENFGLLKHVKLRERLSLMFRAELFNAFNRTVFAAPPANVSNAQFGRISGQANAPRQGQLALRLDF
jgi:hypothetical protein